MNSANNFNPRTPCGVRLCFSSRTPTGPYFNPRTPCGVRPVRHGADDLRYAISIHAPLAGCDQDASSYGYSYGISIHAPLAGCDLLPKCGKNRFQCNFNPRTPCGVRLFDSRDGFDTLRISIHAPLAGCDDGSPARRCDQLLYFNPRTPCGVRPAIILICGIVETFQSTHPLRGATGYQPVRGSSKTDFNPRTPCGVRL